MSIYDKKYQIFISSTYTDLIKAREEVIKVVLSLYQIPIGMEMFSADNDEQWSIIQTTIENSDYYILIIGHRYGSLTKEQISYTEKEFDYAKSIGLPVIAFIRLRNTPTTPDQRDDDIARTKKLDKFLKKAKKDSMCDFWGNEDELASKVAISLTKLFFKTPRIGWVKANTLNSAETTEELTKLIQENRELREKILKLTPSIEKPKIQVILNNESKELTRKSLSNHSMLGITNIYYHGMSEHHKRFVTQGEVDLYNSALIEKKEQIQSYITELEKYENIKFNYTKLRIEIKNSGSIKANDVFIDIKFPQQVFLGEFDDIQDFNKPKFPDIPENPMLKAERLYNHSRGQFSNFDGMYARAIDTLNYANRNFWINKDNNSLTIKIDKIIQTRSIIIDDGIFIAPLAIGQFEYSISIICSEYPEEEKTFVSINISE